MELESKPLCKFGAKCYRRNPKHFESYSHPEESGVKESSSGATPKKISESPKRRMKQTTLKFPNKYNFSEAPKAQKDTKVKKNVPIKNEKKETESGRSREVLGNKKISKRSKRKSSFDEKEAGLRIQEKKPKTSNCFKSNTSNDEINESNDDAESIKSTSWIFIKNESNETEKSDPKDSNVIEADLKNKTNEEIIKTLFLVDMPPDFYSFYDFFKSVEESFELKNLHLGELKLVGPFDVLSGNLNYSVDKDLYLRHWRFFYDPPEFQTVLASESGFHIGYWRDDPKENPVFLASNNPNKNCIFKAEAGNIFGAVSHYLTDYIKTCDPFSKVKMKKLQTALTDWAHKNKFSLGKDTKEMIQRHKKVVSKTFHGAGIVVPVDSETKVGYRPLIQTDANLKKICKLLIEADSESERKSLWENLQPVITAAHLANDECDFGNSLELGIDLFCMGSPLFHKIVEHLLTVAYSLLDRTEFEKIIQVHLKHRKNGTDLGGTGISIVGLLVYDYQQYWLLKDHLTMNFKMDLFKLVSLNLKNISLSSMWLIVPIAAINLFLILILALFSHILVPLLLL